MTLLITGCGFHLRGMVDMPQWLDNIAIIIQDAHRDIGPLLNEQLRIWHVHTSSDPALAKYWLVIEHDDFQQQISSISSSTTPRQYQLIYTVRFTFQRAKSTEIIPSTQIMVTRQLTVNSERILGSNNEEEELKSEMRRDAAIQILGRLGRSTRIIQPEHVN